MADAPASGAGGGDPVEVQVLSAAPTLIIREVNRMDNYEAFKEFMDANEVRYTEDKFESGDRFFSVPHRIKNGALINVIVVFAKTKIKILALGIAEVEDEKKRAAFYELFNSFSMKYAFFKMYIRPEGRICAETDLALDVVNGEFSAKGLMNFVMAAVFFVEKVYPEIMKIQWTD